MGNFELLLTNVIGMHLQTKNYSAIWQAMIVDRSVFPALLNSATEDQVIAFLAFYGPLEGEEVLDGDLQYICQEILLLAYAKQWYKLCGYIYGMGFGMECFDPLCGDRNPLAFGAVNHNPGFVTAFIEGQKRFDYLSFDGVRCCEDGQYRTLPEELVLVDCVEVVALCLENGMDPNAFGFRGDRLLDITRSEKMKELLATYGATNATEQERYLVWTANELRHESLKRNTVNAFLSTEPLLKLTWYNGSTKRSQLQQADVFYEAALACCSELLEELYPYVKAGLDDERRRTILRAVLGHECLPCSRIWGERPVDIARSLEALNTVGFRYGEETESSAKHRIIEMIRYACCTFTFRDQIPFRVQLRIFTALWEIGGSPKDDGVIQALAELAQEHPATAMEMFIPRVKYSDEEE